MKILRVMMSLGIASILLTNLIAEAQTIIPKEDEKKGTWGYVAPGSGKWVVKPKYDTAENLSECPNGKMRGKVTLKGKTGFVDESGKPLGVGIVFDEISPMKGDAMWVTVKGLKGVANYDGIYTIKPEISDVENLGNEGYIVTIKGKKGLIDLSGKFVIDPEYAEIEANTPGYFIINKGGKIGIMDRVGKLLLEPKEFTAVKPSGNYWQVIKGDKVGLYDISKQALVIKNAYKQLGAPVKINNETLLSAQKPNGKWGVLYIDGQTSIKFDYLGARIIPSLSQVMLNRMDGTTGFYDFKMKKFGTYIDVKENQEGPFVVFSAFIEASKVFDILNPDASEIRKISTVSTADGNVVGTQLKKLSKAYVVLEEQKASIYDLGGKKLIEFPCPGGTKASVSEIQGWIVVNEQAISPEFNILTSMKLADNLFVEKDGKYFILKDGVVSGPGFGVEDFYGKNGFMLVKDIIDSRWHYVDKDGKLSDMAFDFIDTENLTSNGVIDVSCDGKWGTADKNGIVSPIDKDYPPLGTLKNLKELVATPAGENCLEYRAYDEKSSSVKTIYYNAMELNIDGYDLLLCLDRNYSETSKRSIDDIYVRIKKYNGSDLNVVVPETFEYAGIDIPVRKIGRGAFYNSKIKTISLPANLNQIERGAFSNCEDLMTVKLANKHVDFQYETFGGGISDLYTFIDCPNLSFFESDLVNVNSNNDYYSLKRVLGNFWGSDKFINEYLNRFAKSVSCTKKLADDISMLHENFDGMFWHEAEAKILRRWADAGNKYALDAICNSKVGGNKAVSEKEFFKYAKANLSKGNYYWMGVAYENGIGVAPDRRMANSYYAKGRNKMDSYCEKGWWRTL